jgi:hypothetical protein
MRYRWRFKILKTSDELPTSAHPGMGYVYVLGRHEDGPVKVGVSVYPRKRVKELECANGGVFRLIWLSPECWNYPTIEAYLHDRMRSYRTHGEWFTVPFHLTVQMAEDMKYRRQPYKQRLAELAKAAEKVKPIG